MSPTLIRSPRRRRSRSFHALALVLSLAAASLVAVCVLSVHSWRARSRVEAALASQGELLRLSGEIARLDEALSSSARMAAATGDSAWEQRHRDDEASLAAAISEAERLEPHVAGRFLRDFKGSNAALVVLEQSAMRRAAEGDRTGALALLGSQPYTEHRDRSRATLDRLTETLVARTRHEASASSLQAVLWMGALAGVTAALVLLGRALFLRERQRTRLQARAEDAERRTALAQQSSRARSEFVVGMVQGLRAPAHTALGMADMLLDTPLSPDQRQYADTIRADASSLVGAIADALDYSRIEAGDLEIEALPLDLAALVEDVAALMAPRARARGLELVSSVAASMPRPLVGDPLRLRQVLLHLLANAVDCTCQGEVVVRVTMAGRDAAGGSIRVEVRDTGIGIAEADRPRLFRSFSRLDRSAAREHRGLGLGLALCRRLAELMGGHVGLESEPGHGSTFWFTARVAIPTSAAPDDAPLGLAGVRVLVADDSEACCATLRELLEHWGARVISALDESTTVARWRESIENNDPFGLVLLDPGIDGADGTRLVPALRAGGREPSAVVVLGHTGRDLASVPKALEARACVPKPVRRSDLAQAVAAVLQAPAVAAHVAPRRSRRSTREPRLAARGRRRA